MHVTDGGQTAVYKNKIKIKKRKQTFNSCVNLKTCSIWDNSLNILIIISLLLIKHYLSKIGNEDATSEKKTVGNARSFFQKDGVMLKQKFVSLWASGLYKQYRVLICKCSRNEDRNFGSPNGGLANKKIVCAVRIHEILVSLEAKNTKYITRFVVWLVKWGSTNVLARNLTKVDWS